MADVNDSAEFGPSPRPSLSQAPPNTASDGTGNPEETAACVLGGSSPTAVEAQQPHAGGVQDGHRAVNYPMRPIQQQTQTSRPSGAVPVRGHILLVDDDPDVARVSAVFLRRAGFVVTLVNDADAALTVLAEGATFDALITDHAMLGMRGADLIMQARERYPAMPAMMITGYAGAEGLEALAPDVTILSKPFQREEFLNKVLSMLLGVRTSSRLQSLPTS